MLQKCVLFLLNKDLSFIVIYHTLLNCVRLPKLNKKVSLFYPALKSSVFGA